ncbi:MAG: cytochrome P450 [Ardenticatenaceae bacterium]|nr:cytochrome P450 [Ardenticatenaceae bacterium]
MYDLFSPVFKADPFPLLAQLRRECPVYAHHAPDGRIIWYITRYEDVLAVLKDDVHFVKDVRHATEAAVSKPATRTLDYRLINENMLFSDPPDHTRLRALVNQAFTPRRVERMAAQVQRLADDLLDKVAPLGEMDVIGDYALPLPVAVITQMLGVPPEDQAQVTDWSQAIISPGSRGLTYSQRKAKIRAFLAYLQQMFAERQRAPQDDLVTALVQAEEAGERLNEEELFSMVALLLVTGHETTVNLIGNGVLALLGHPEQLALVQAGAVGWETAVEELLRYDGPVETSTTRWVGQDVQFQGHWLRRGDMVRVVLTSANRDACQFANADVLDFGREDNRHLAFGLGIHYCLGAPLARLEGKVALRSLFGRFPHLHLKIPVEQLPWRSGVLFRGLKRFPVSLGH